MRACEARVGSMPGEKAKCYLARDSAVCGRPSTWEADSKWNSLKFDSNILFLLSAWNSYEMKLLVLFRAGRDDLEVSP